MQCDKYASVRSTANSTIQDKNRFRCKTQARTLKYRAAKPIDVLSRTNPELQLSMNFETKTKNNQQEVKLVQYIKDFNQKRAISINSNRRNSNQGTPEKQKRQLVRNKTIDDDVMSRASKLSQMSRISKYGDQIKDQFVQQGENQNKQISKQLALKVRNQSIFNWNSRKMASRKRFYNDGNSISEMKSQISRSDVNDNQSFPQDQAQAFSHKARKLKTQSQINRIMQLKQEQNQLLQDQELWNSPQIKAILEKYNIKDQFELQQFLQNNQDYLPNLYSTNHLNNLRLQLHPQTTQYNRRYCENKGQSNSDTPILTDENYETLHRLAMLKQSLKKLTTTQLEFYKKQTDIQQSLLPEDQIHPQKKQITYTTTYGFNFPNMLDYEPKIIYNPVQQHVVKGYPLFGQTQYKNNYVQAPNQTFTAAELAQFFKQKQTNRNPMKMSKGVNFFNTTYRRQFFPKSSDHKDDGRLRPASQQECSVQHCRQSVPSMYLSCAQNQYTKFQTQIKKRHKGQPNKFGTLSRLKTILLLNKSLKKQIAPHVPRDSARCDYL